MCDETKVAAIGTVAVQNRQADLDNNPDGSGAAAAWANQTWRGHAPVVQQRQ